MFANRFTALLDANVLVPALGRNLLLSLAEAELFRPRWSVRIMDETSRAIAGILERKADTDPVGSAARAIEAMRRAFPEAEVAGFEAFETALANLPDPGDAHVIAAAKQTAASIIVTENIKDFPLSVLEPLGLEAKPADAFIADTIDLDTGTSVQAVARMRARFRSPAIGPAALLLLMEARGLGEAADMLRPHEGSL